MLPKWAAPIPFAPPFVGGDDPTTAIVALTNINTKLELKIQELHREKLNLWTPLAALMLANGGQLRVRDGLFVSPDTAISMERDSADPKIVVLKFVAPGGGE